MAASVAPAGAPHYFTTRAEVKTGKGQAVRFAKGKGYYAGAPVPAAAGGAGAPDLSMYGLSPAQLRAMVASEVAAQVNPERAALRSAQGTTDKQYAAEQAAVAALTKEYAGVLKGIGPEVQDAYGGAANSVADFSKGYSGAVQGALDSAGASEKGLLGVAGAPAGQVAAANGALKAPTDALYGLTGAIPAGALAREGAAFTSAADMLPGEAIGRGQQTALEIHGAQHATDQKYHDQLSALLASIPNLRTGAENNILKNARSDVAEQLLLQRYGLQSRTELGNLTGVDPATGQPTYRAATTAARTQAAADTKRQAAIGKRNKATSSLLTKLSSWVYQQRHRQGAVVVGHEPRERTQKDAAGLTITQFLTPQGWVTATHAPPNTIQKPIYDQHHQIPANYQSMKTFLTRQLTVGLKAYGYKPSDIQEMVTELIGAPPPLPPIVLHKSGVVVPRS